MCLGETTWLLVCELAGKRCYLLRDGACWILSSYEEYINPIQSNVMERSSCLRRGVRIVGFQFA